MPTRTIIRYTGKRLNQVPLCIQLKINALLYVRVFAELELVSQLQIRGGGWYLPKQWIGIYRSSCLVAVSG